jgi:hypothetical protein
MLVAWFLGRPEKEIVRVPVEAIPTIELAKSESFTVAAAPMVRGTRLWSGKDKNADDEFLNPAGTPFVWPVETPVAAVSQRYLSPDLFD